MSFESNEDRIRKLEKEVSGLVALQRSMIKAVVASLQPIPYLLESISLVKEDQLSILRFIGSQPVFGTADERQKFMDIVARSETNWDQLRARLADMKTTLPPLPPNSQA